MRLRILDRRLHFSLALRAALSHGDKAKAMPTPRATNLPG
jgi:hypothetical protein